MRLHSAVEAHKVRATLGEGNAQSNVMSVTAHVWCKHIVRVTLTVVKPGQVAEVNKLYAGVAAGACVVDGIRLVVAVSRPRVDEHNRHIEGVSEELSLHLCRPSPGAAHESPELCCRMKGEQKDVRCEHS